jgi:CelD/BcsL family acetyltransferase involved in cellulose biosynthesis
MQGEEPTRQAADPSTLTIRRWSVEEWLSNEVAWNRLVARSATDALFLSWEWLTNWWHCFGGSVGGVTEILAFYQGADLVGLAPLYCRRLVRGGFVPTRSVQFLGLSWRDDVPLISEYLDVIAAAPDLERVREECVRFLLREPGWTEFVAGFTPAAAGWRELYRRCATPRVHYVRELDRSVAYQADLTSGFPAYLRDLHQSTRRSIWNLRRRLHGYGTVHLEELRAADIASGFRDLNRLHELRWQKPAFGVRRLQFHTTLAQRLAAHGELALSRLWVGGNVVSVLYDVRKGTRQYNIKMAFDPGFNPQLSLGLLHLGYAMEAAAERRVGCYDFLAGPGRSSDFKRLLSQQRLDLSCVQMLRGALLTSLYRWGDRVRQR